MTGAQIRDWLRGLLGSRYAMHLEAELDEMRSERDYFKGRAERLELMLLPKRQEQSAASVSAASVGPKSWLQVQQEWDEQQQAEQAAESKAKEN